MCGICGATGASDKDALRNMVGILRHRGPDDLGFYVDDDIVLGQCRLSIIDLKTGRQPIYNEDRSVVVVYNGEIYNYRELRRELETKGHTFSTNSDTEVIVHEYEQYGLDCLQNFNGMFAFALYDSRKRRLILARDRQGIKPLYYMLVDGQLVFASEIKSILKHPAAKRRLNYEAVGCFLTLRYVPLDATLFSDIRKVLPGHYVVFDESGMKQVCYWRLQPRPHENHVTPAELMDALKRSVERHMISDVPVGVYLSGGIDSASLVALASELSDVPINTFSMGFGEETDELRDGKTVADHFGTVHFETIVNGGLLSDFPKMIWHMDCPKRNLYPYYLAQLASKHVKVVLGGLGGDELFGGYTFRYSVLSSLKPRTAQEKVKAYLETQARDVCQDQAEVYGTAIPEESLQYPNRFFRAYYEDELPFNEQVLATDFNAKMIYDFLPVDDAMSMAHSVETRVPYLDNELVDLAFEIPFSDKFRDGKGKVILAQAMSSRLPRIVLEKRKQGFGPNPYEIYKNELRYYAENYLPLGFSVKRGLVSLDWVKSVLGKDPSYDAVAEYNKLWDCLGLEVFLRIYFDGDVKDSPTWDII